MRFLSRLFILILTSVAVLAGCEEAELKEPYLLELDRGNMKMTVGQSQKLNAVLQGSTQKCEWASDNQEVAVVSEDGTVTAVGVGNAVITVSGEGLTCECKVEVVAFTADKLDLNPKIVDGLVVIAVGGELDIDPKFYKSGEKVNDLAYPEFTMKDAVPSREGETVASLSEDGILSVMAPGVVNVTVSGAGKSSTFKLMAKEVTLDEESINLFVNETANLSVSILPEGLPEAETLVEWYSSDKETVTVDAQGRLRALKSSAEPVVITAVANGVSAECEVIVSDYVAHSVSFTNLDNVLRKKDGSYEMYIGEKPVVLTAAFSDSEGNDVSSKVIDQTFSSSDRSVASVNAKGQLEVHAPGKVEITVSGAKVETSFDLSVIKGVESLSISPSGVLPVIIGSQPFTIDAEVLPADASVKGVSFVSDTPSVASVDPKTGKVTVGKGGIARITVTTDGYKIPVLGEDGKYVYEALTAVLLVNVGKPSDMKVTIESDAIVDGTLVVQKGKSVQLRAVTDFEGFSGTISWMPADDIVSVDKTGKLTALAVGTTVMAVMAEEDGLTAMAELPISVTGINPTAIEIVNGKSLSVPVNETPVTLVAKATAPSNADFGGVNWYSSDEKIVKVDETGKLTYLGVGKAVITAKAKSWDGIEELAGVQATFEVELGNAPVTDFDIVRISGGIEKSGVYYIEEGATMKLGYVTVPIGSQPQTVSWRSANSNVAEVSDEGLVRGVACSDDAGTEVVISCIIDGTIQEDLTIYVVKVQPKDIELTMPGRKLKVGESWNLNPKVLPESLGLRAIPTFGSPISDSGVLTAYSPGYVNFGFYVSREEFMILDFARYYTVEVEPYWVTGLTLPQTYEIEAGSNVILTPSFTSDVDGVAPTYRNLVWTSSNPSVATVNSNTGEVTAHKAGYAEITATTSHEWAVPQGESHKTAVCAVTVNEAAQAINVGDYYYSDGTWSSELDPSKTVIGIVFSKVNAASYDSRLGADYPGCTHGLVVSTAQYETAFAKDREWGRADLVNWMRNNGYTQIDDLSKYCGYGNTKGMEAINSANVSSYGDVIRIDLCDAVKEHRGNVEAPASSSGWYIPSYQEMRSLYDNFDTVNSAIEAVGGTPMLKTYTIKYSRSDGKELTASKGQQYYYSNVNYDYIKAFDMSKASEQTPAVYKDGDAFNASSSGEKTELPVRIVLAF